MKIYRAMCDEEFIKTVEFSKPHFIRRFKWFSHNLDWVNSRVRDGNFNNSKFKTEKYKRLCEFDYIGESHDFMSKNEIQFDVRRNPNIKFIREIK